MNKIWLNSYQDGVPSTIEPEAYSSLNEIFQEAFATFPAKPMFSSMGTTLSYQQIDELSNNFASFLQNNLQLKKGDKIAIILPNILQYPVALIGALRAGLIIVNVNPLYTAREMQEQLVDCEATTVLILENFAKTLSIIIPNTLLQNIIVTRIGDLLSLGKGMLVNFIVKYVKKLVPEYSLPNAISFKDCLRLGRSTQFKQVNLMHTDIAFLQYTGGTTGRCKGAILTHRNMVANVLQASAWIKPNIQLGQEVIVTALPLYHIFALVANVLCFTKIGALNVLILNPRDIPAFVRELKKIAFTAITGVNTLFNALLNDNNFAHMNFSALKIVVAGGMSVQASVASRFYAVTKVPIIEAYGLTEASPAVCINPLNSKEYTGSIGLPVPSTDISIRDDADNEVALGMMGELWVKGPQVMHGYWNKADETVQTLKNGWLKTGDMAVVDDNGYVKILDRKKDFIIVSGFNVYPNEVEEVLMSYHKILDAAVVGIKNSEGIEVVTAFVVAKVAGLSREEIIEHCRNYLTAYKVPKEIEFRSELPKTHIGKVLRKSLV